MTTFPFALSLSPLALSFVGLPATFGGAWPALPLAQMPDPKDYTAVGWLMVALFGLVGFAGVTLAAVNGFITLREKLRDKRDDAGPHRIEQPLRVTAEVEFARLSELHKLRSEFESFEEVWTINAQELRDKIDEKFSESIHASNSSASKVHNRIDAMAGVQGQLIGELKQVGENVRLLLQRLGGKS